MADTVTLDVTIRTRDASNNLLLSREFSYSAAVGVTRTQIEHQVATGQTGETVNLSDVADASLLFVSSDKAVSLLVTGGGTDQVIAVDANGCLLIQGTVTALKVTNTSGATATLKVIAIT